MTNPITHILTLTSSEIKVILSRFFNVLFNVNFILGGVSKPSTVGSAPPPNPILYSKAGAVLVSQASNYLSGNGCLRVFSST